MCVHWYLAEHFSKLSYRFFSKSKGRILDELRVSFKCCLLHRDIASPRHAIFSLFVSMSTSWSIYIFLIYVIYFAIIIFI